MENIETARNGWAGPDHVMIIGGGRWARVYLDVLNRLLPGSVTLSVHSRHHSGPMLNWIGVHIPERRVRVSPEWPPAPPDVPAAAIVVNGARDHLVAARWAIEAGLPTLVEKPIALTAADATELQGVARERRVPLAGSNLFPFARYMENFSDHISQSGRVERFRLDWSDPATEARYGELKTYDASIPIFADWMPHVVPIIEFLLKRVPDVCRAVKTDRGGALVEIDLVTGEIPCTVRIERNGMRRQRLIEVDVEGATLRLDFSVEPGTIVVDRASPLSQSADEDWERAPRPVARMLMAFLGWAAGGQADVRLNTDTAVHACRMIDEAAVLYRSTLSSWLTGRMQSPEPVDRDLRYALTEILQVDERLAGDELERRIKRVVDRFSGSDGPRLSRELAASPDAILLLSSLAA